MTRQVVIHNNRVDEAVLKGSIFLASSVIFSRLSFSRSSAELQVMNDGHASFDDGMFRHLVQSRDPLTLPPPRGGGSFFGSGLGAASKRLLTRRPDKAPMQPRRRSR